MRRRFIRRRKSLWEALKSEVWNRPLILLVGLYIVSIVVLDAATLPVITTYFIFLVIATCLTIAKSRFRGGLVFVLAVVLLGVSLRSALYKSRPSLRTFAGQAVVLVGGVVREPLSTGGGYRTLIDVETVSSHGNITEVQGEVWLYLPRGIKLDYLDRIEVTGKLQESRRRGRATALWISVGDARLLQKIGRRELGGIERAGGRMRAEVAEVLEPILPQGYRELQAGLLGSLFFGIHGASLPKELTDLFRRTGSMHILVVSGTQISLLFMLVYFPGIFVQWRRRQMLLRRLSASGAEFETLVGIQELRGLPRLLPSPRVVVLGLVLMCLYAVLTQGGKPVARAAVMAGLVGISLLLGRVAVIAEEHSLDIDRYNLLAAAALGILIIDPAAVRSPGFQLSFAAVWGIIFLAPRLRRLIGFMSDFWAWLLVGPVAAQAATLPIVAWHFGSVPLIGFITNLVAVPIAALLLWLGLAAFLVGLIWWLPAWPLGWLCGKLCWLMTRSLALLSEVPGGVVIVDNFPWPMLVGYYLVLVGLGGLLGWILPERRDDLAGLEGAR